jgi:hypothetical protein
MAGSAPVRTEVDAYQFPVHAAYSMAVAAAASQVIKGAPGRLCVIVITAAGAGAGPVLFYDNATAASGEIIAAIPSGPVAIGSQFPVDLPAMNGIYCAGVASGPGFTVGYS